MAQFPAKAEVGARLPPDAKAVAGALGLARRFAAAAGLDPDATGRLAVVVEEWVSNVVEHGGPQGQARIVLRLSLEGEAVRLSVSDAGQPFDPRVAAAEGPDPEHGGGVGLALITGLGRIVEYARRAGRNRLVLEVPLG